MTQEDTRFQFDPNFEWLINLFPFFNCLKNDPILIKDIKIFKTIIVLWIFAFISFISQFQLKILMILILTILYLYLNIYLFLISIEASGLSILKRIPFPITSPMMLIGINFIILPIYTIIAIKYVIDASYTYSFLFLISIFIAFYLRFKSKMHTRMRLYELLDFATLNPLVLTILLIFIVALIEKKLNLFGLFSNIIFNNILNIVPFIHINLQGLNLFLLIILPFIFILKIAQYEKKIKNYKYLRQQLQLSFIFDLMLLFFSTIVLFVRIFVEYTLILSLKLDPTAIKIHKDFVFGKVFNCKLFIEESKNYFSFVCLNDFNFLELYIGAKELKNRVVLQFYFMEPDFASKKKLKHNIALNFLEKRFLPNYLDIMKGIRNHIVLFGSNKKNVVFAKNILKNQLCFSMGFGYTKSCIEIEQELFNLFIDYNNRSKSNRKIVIEFHSLQEKFFNLNLSNVEQNIITKKFEKFSNLIKNYTLEKTIEDRDILIKSSIQISEHCLYSLYLFSWEEVPGNDSERLLEFLKQEFDISWVETAKIEKIDNDRNIRVTAEKNYLSLGLNNEKTKVNLKIDDGRSAEFVAKSENGKPNISKIYYSLLADIQKKEVNDFLSHYFKNKLNYLDQLKNSSNRYSDEFFSKLNNLRNDLIIVTKIIKKYKKLEADSSWTSNPNSTKLINQLDILCKKINDNNLREFIKKEVNILKN